MRKVNTNLKVLAMAVSLCALTSCDQDNDELAVENEVAVIDESDLAAKGTCDTDFFELIDAISGTDYNSGISTKIDDRSCSYDYVQTTLGSKYNWGRYRLKSSDNSGRLQVRMERTSKRLNFTNNATLEFNGYARILNVGTVEDNAGPSANNDGDGTYIAQVKGRHDKIVDKESKDPAIILFIAKPKRDSDGDVIFENNQVKEFDIWAEQVKSRGGAGSGPNGRELKRITTVKRNKNFKISIKSTFSTSNGVKKQTIAYTINGASKTYDVPTTNTRGETTAPIETRVRIGAYRCRGGSADILFRDKLSVK